MADSFECKKISNKQNNDELFFSDQEEDPKKQGNAALQIGDIRQDKVEKQHQGNYEHFERFSDFDEDENQFQPEYNFVEGPRDKEKRRKFVPQVDQKDIMPTCGCRDTPYSNNKMLFFHIKKQHGGVAPPGTIIGHHKARKQKKPNNDNRAMIEIHQELMGQKDYDLSNMQDFRDGSEYSQNYPHSLYGSEQSERGYSNQQQASNRKLVKEQSNGQRQPREERICSFCGLVYLSKWAYCLHILVKHPTKKLDEKTLKNESKFNNNDDKKRPFKCECGKAYTQNSSLGLHIREKHNGFYIKELQEFKDPSENSEPEGDDRLKKEIEEHLQAQRLAEKEKDSQEVNFSSEDQYQEDSDLNTTGGKKLEDAKRRRMQELLAEQEYKSKYKTLYQCGCGLRYSCSSSLGLHIKRNHNYIAPAGTIGASKTLITDNKSQKRMPKPRQLRKPRQEKSQQQSEQEKIFKCGCNRNYSCSSALGLHIKRNHEGLAPIGTIGCPATLVIGDYYYIQPPKPPKDRSHKCGCGRTYVHSSTLGLHIKHHHKSIAPKGTIGCPKRYSLADQSQPNPLSCQICGTNELKSHFKCQTCASHLICSKCFWSGSYFSPEHQWVIQYQDSE